MNENHSTTNPPVAYNNCADVGGPFYHGTRAVLEAGTHLVPGHGSNFQQGRVSNHLCFTTLVETAAWGAKLAAALGGSGERGHIYVVEPLGPFEDDPKVSNKRFPGNPTRYPLRVVAELETWQGHAPEVLSGSWITSHSSGSRTSTSSRTKRSGDGSTRGSGKRLVHVEEQCADPGDTEALEPLRVHVAVRAGGVLVSEEVDPACRPDPKGPSLGKSSGATWP